MRKIQIRDISQYVEQNIGRFHEKRIQSLENLNLGKVLKRKNPYLFKAKHVLTAAEIIKALTDAHISSNEETVFGDWLEGLALFINSHVYGGWKSGIKGIDIEFDKDGKRYIVAVKSGPNWGNSSQIAKMKTDFVTAARTLRTSNSELQVIAVNGCCYGKDKKPDKGAYFKYCGQDFWNFISGAENLYTEIVVPIGYKAKEKNERFIEAYASMMNKFTLQFATSFCLDNGAIDWERLVRFNSATQN